MRCVMPILETTFVMIKIEEVNKKTNNNNNKTKPQNMNLPFFGHHFQIKLKTDS